MTMENLTAATQSEVRALILEGLAEHWGDLDESLNADLNDMLSTYAAGRTLVVRNAEGTIVGTGTIRPVPDERAEIVRMSVGRDARRLGVGAMIVEELVATARTWNCVAVVLETTTAWTEVVAFYESCGFVVTGTVGGGIGSDTWFSLDLTAD